MLDVTCLYLEFLLFHYSRSNDLNDHERPAFWERGVTQMTCSKGVGRGLGQRGREKGLGGQGVQLKNRTKKKKLRRDKKEPVIKRTVWLFFSLSLSLSHRATNVNTDKQQKGLFLEIFLVFFLITTKPRPSTGVVVGQGQTSLCWICKKQKQKRAGACH